MNRQELFYLIALLQIKGVGNITARNLIAITGSCEAIFREKPSNLLRIQGIGINTVQEILKANMEKAAKEIEFIEKNNIATFTYSDENYPSRLNDCVDAPLLLYYKGNTDLNAVKTISLVGTRNATEYGKELSERLIADLSEKYPELLVISGLAYGIDIAAHKAALKHNLPTIGIIAHGLDRIYPATHRKTAVEMVSHGGLLTEYPSGTNPDRQNFVMRNRIIAGLSDAVIVVESAEKGGALITAEVANSYNRDVFAFPGRTTDVSSRGCNNLILQNKASLIQSAEDLINLMGWDKVSSTNKVVQQQLFLDLTEEEQLITNLLKENTPKQINLLSIESNLPVYRLSPILLELEFKGLVKCMPGGTYSLR
ncbi:MAG: DNA-processing protein DprA [Bacteroidota bacterium]|nr:DNA-processing protein DprA [Bacteroidota bacterium]